MPFLFYSSDTSDRDLVEQDKYNEIAQMKSVQKDFIARQRDKCVHLYDFNSSGLLANQCSFVETRMNETSRYYCDSNTRGSS